MDMLVCVSHYYFSSGLQFEDFHKYAIQGTLKGNAKLERSVFLFNNITFWVQCMVLGQHTPQERAAIIAKFVTIAKVSLIEFFKR